MDPFQQEIVVAFRFPVHFTTGVFSPDNVLLRDLLAGETGRPTARAIVVVDGGVLAAHPDLTARVEAYGRRHAAAVTIVGPVVDIPGGEQAKNDPAHVAAIHRAIHAAGLCRHSYVVAVGGGALLDVAGYAAATAHRGIRLVRVATTVLSQDDSAVGVKNGVNVYGKKNYFGTFAPPFAVVNDFDFLDTLSDRDWRAGLSEAVKAALVRDASFFDHLERQAPKLVARDRPAIEEVIRRSAALHLTHIARGGDPFELGTSRPLDFGHWAAHKLEQLTDHRLRHGEAVSIGIALDCTYAHLCGHLSQDSLTRILDLLAALGLPLYAPELAEHPDEQDPRSILQGLAEFREHLGGQLTIMLLEGIGNAFDVHEIRTDVMMRSVERLQAADHVRAAASARPVS